MSLVVGLSLAATWLRDEAWRAPESRVDDLFTVRHDTDIARLADDSGIDFLFCPDALRLDPTVLHRSPGFSSIDPIVRLSALAAVTDRIGLIPTVSSLYSPAFTTARQLASIDALSGGRVGVNIVTSTAGADNYAPVHTDDAYADAADFVETIERLHHSYAHDAIIADRESGVFADVSRVRSIEPIGRHFGRGPLTVPAQSAGRWPLLHAGTSRASHAFAGRYADGVFAMAPTPEHGAQLRTTLRAEAHHAGRPPRAVRVLPGLSLTLGATPEQAAQIAASAGERIGPAHVNHWTVIGTAQLAADEIARRWDADSLDGVIVLPGGTPDTITRFCEDVVPILTRRGLMSPGTTLFPKSTP